MNKTSDYIHYRLHITVNQRKIIDFILKFRVPIKFTKVFFLRKKLQPQHHLTLEVKISEKINLGLGSERQFILFRSALNIISSSSTLILLYFESCSSCNIFVIQKRGECLKKFHYR